MPKKKHRLSSRFESTPMEDANPPTDSWLVSEEAPEQDYSVVQGGLAEGDHAMADEIAPLQEPLAREEEAAPVGDHAIDDEIAPPAEPHAFEGKAAPLDETKADEAAAMDVGRVQDQFMEVISICTSCTTMVFTECEGPCPYSFVSLMGSDHTYYSWFLHTTCSSCVKKHKGIWGTREDFGNKCMAAFKSAALSEDFMKRTSWFEIAGRVCQKPVKILMNEQRQSVAYVKIDDLREETTDKCKIRGLKSVGSGDKQSSSTEIVESFMPGGFM